MRLRDMDKDAVIIRRKIIYLPHEKDEAKVQNFIYDTLAAHFPEKITSGKIRVKFFLKNKIDVWHDLRARELWVTVKKKKIGKKYKY